MYIEFINTRSTLGKRYCSTLSTCALFASFQASSKFTEFRFVMFTNPLIRYVISNQHRIIAIDSAKSIAILWKTQNSRRKLINEFNCYKSVYNWTAQWYKRFDWAESLRLTFSRTYEVLTDQRVRDIEIHWVPGAHWTTHSKPTDARKWAQIPRNEYAKR